jgi:hypothetical protein
MHDYLRSLFTAGALAVIRYARIHGTRCRPWLTALLARRPTKVAAIALANKLARMAWAMMAGNERYKEPDVRWAPGDIEAMRTCAKELVALNRDVILADTTAVTAALRRETRTIPIVFSIVANPVGSGFVASLARPGGNMTGLGLVEASFASKWLGPASAGLFLVA